MSPHLNDIVDIVTELKIGNWPQARTVVLTNGTLLQKSSVRSALARWTIVLSSWMRAQIGYSTS